MDKNKILSMKKVIVFIAVLCIPIMYSFFYLKSYWDPYGKMDQMTVAMVNLDKGYEGQHLGQDFIDALIEKDVVDIKQVDAEKAQKGLEEEKYFAVITVPENFSEYLNSASGTDKKVAKITYSPNQKYNYLASQIISRVVSSAEATLENQVSEKVVETLSDNLKEIPDSLGEINDGVDQLLDGSSKLSSGLGEINTGVGTLQSNYNQFDSGVDSAYTGSQTLTSGIGQVNTGVGQLDSGATQLDSGIAQINDGANTLSSQAGAGITKLTNGINQLNSGAAQLAAGTSALVAGTAADSQLGAGASNLNAGVTQYVDSVNGSVGTIIDGTASAAATNAANAAASTTATQVIGAVNGAISQSGLSDEEKAAVSAIVAQVPAGTIASGVSGQVATQVTSAVSSSAKANPSLAQLKTGGDSLKAGAAGLSAGITQLNSNAQQLNNGAQALSAGTTQLAGEETTASLNKLVNGIGTLKSALGQVQTGTGNLKGGVKKLSSGTNQLQTGSQTLTNGLGTLSSSSKQVKDALGKLSTGTQAAYDGSIQLKDGLQELKDGVTEGIDKANGELVKLDGLSEYVKNSVEVEEIDFGEVTAYGTAFTPLFISVALWVGGLMAYVVLYYDQDKRFKLLGKYADNKLMQCLMYLGIAVLQGIVTAFLLDLGLDLHITNYGLYYSSCVLIAVTFMSIIQFLIMNFGEVGKFLGLLILVLQLASSGGTFPVALIDEGFQKLSPYLPMTYTIKLTKEAVIARQKGFAGKNIAIMLGYTVACLAITAIVQFVKKKNSENKKEQNE